MSLVLVTLVLAACNPSTTVERDTEPVLQTDRLGYRPRKEGPDLAADIPYTFTNRTGAPVYLMNCNGGFALRLERLEQGYWATVWAPNRELCLSPPIIIQPGEQFEDTVHVWGARQGTNIEPKFDRVDPSGIYRIVWIDALSSFQDRLPFGEQIPEEYRVSNRFVLRR